jgi:mycobactin lysine-N-oxygenase
VGRVAQQNIAVVGGGPKAVALAAKAFCLRQIGIPISVSIFEKDAIGAAWDGRHGYTDGAQRLCTPAERDLGFPYDPGLAKSVAERMQAQFSWAAYQVAKSEPSYVDWVSRGRKPPTHRDFADYLGYAVRESKSATFLGRVTGLRVENALWTIDQIDRETKRKATTQGFHGVVVTGPGPAARRFSRVSDPRVLTGQSFWAKLVAVRRLLRRVKNQIVIIGGGGTAAAIAAWFVRAGLGPRKVVLLHNQATLFTRTTSFFENRIFDDEAAWLSLEEEDRRSFTLRLNRGVVWESVTEVLADAPQLTLVPGRSTAIRHGVHRPGARRPDLVVNYSNHLGGGELTAEIVVDAAGFDAWWFRKLLPGPLRTELEDAKRADELERTMAADLSLALSDWPRLHVPMLSQIVGPGFMSLMVLGAMADRILNPYVKAASA